MQKATAVDFALLLDMCAKAQPKIRIRFSTSNPQDMSLDVIKTMAKHQNICNHVHLPVQSGSNRILEAMNRQHTREEYIELVKNIKRIIPDCSISQDMICGFPTETESDHQDTLSLMEKLSIVLDICTPIPSAQAPWPSESSTTMCLLKQKKDVWLKSLNCNARMVYSERSNI